MTFEDINARFTALVNDYIRQGFILNSTTMGGSQGEYAHIDLTDGKQVIRILVDNFYTNHYGTEGICITVGKCKDPVKPNSSYKDDIIWNGHLSILYTEQFFLIGEKRGGDKFFGTADEEKEAREKRHQRFETRYFSDRQEHDLPEAARAVALRYIQRQPKCKSAKLREIVRVYTVTQRYRGKTTKHYYADFRGRRMSIGGEEA